MTNREEEWNENSLMAWNQWKTICSICGCPSEYKKFLMVEVARAFERKIKSVVGDQLDSLFSTKSYSEANEKTVEEQAVLPSQSGRLPENTVFYKMDESIDDSHCAESLKLASEAEDPAKENIEDVPFDQEVIEKENLQEDQSNISDAPLIQHDFRVDWAHEFDCGIIEKANSEKSPKNYKDLTWECIARSDDPPLKIIRGKLLGHLGIINEIAERYLRNNFHQIWEKQISLQSPAIVGDEEAGTLEDAIADEKTSLRDNSLDQSDKDCLKKSFLNLFSNGNAAIFLIYLTGFSTLFEKKISISIPELQKYVGLSSTSPIYDRLNNVILPKIKALPSECLQAMAVPGASDFLIFLLIEQIKPEKEAIPLLQRVTNEMENFKREAMSNE